MRYNQSPRRSLIPALAVILTLILSACSGPAPTSAPTAAPTSPPATAAAVPTDLPAALPTATDLPTVEPTAEPTATQAPTQTSAPTATLAPTPHPALGEIDLSGLAWMPDYNMLLSFNFPGPVDAEDYRVTLEEKEYRCEVLEQYPNRLYCYGPGAKVLTTAVIRVFPAGSQQAIYEKSYWIPYFQ